jgi:hypothetical protein
MKPMRAAALCALTCLSFSSPGCSGCSQTEQQRGGVAHNEGGAGSKNTAGHQGTIVASDAGHDGRRANAGGKTPGASSSVPQIAPSEEGKIPDSLTGTGSRSGALNAAAAGPFEAASRDTLTGHWQSERWKLTFHEDGIMTMEVPSDGKIEELTGRYRLDPNGVLNAHLEKGRAFQGRLSIGAKNQVLLLRAPVAHGFSIDLGNGDEGAYLFKRAD